MRSLYSTSEPAGVLPAAEVTREDYRQKSRKRGPHLRRALTLTGALALVGACGGCATSHVMVGEARPAISANEVQVYSHPPAVPYEEIARLDTSSQGSFSFTAQSKSDAVIGRLKAEAAKLGANGVLIEGMADESSGSIGTGGGGGSYSGGSSFGGGIGLNAGLSKKVGAGLAIFVPQ